MKETENLVKAIVEGNALEVNEHFQRALATIIAERLNDLRCDVAENMFSEARVYIKRPPHGSRKMGVKRIRFRARRRFRAKLDPVEIESEM